MIEGTKRTFVAGTGGVEDRRLFKLSSGTAVHNTATAADEPLGISEYAAAEGEAFAGRLINGPGTFYVTAAGAFAVGADLYAAANGKVSGAPAATGTYRRVGTALQAATQDGDIIEMQPLFDQVVTKTVVTAGTGGVEASRLVKLSSGEAVHNTATSTDVPIGVTEAAAEEDAALALKLINDSGTFLVTAAGAVTLGADLYAAADGKVSALSATPGTYRRVGAALQAATEDGDIIEMLPLFDAVTTTVSE